MKLDIADSKALSEISPSALTAYLRSRGWAAMRVEHELGFFHKRSIARTRSAMFCFASTLVTIRAEFERSWRTWRSSRTGASMTFIRI